VTESASVRATLRPSRLITAWLAGLHGATLVSLFWSTLPVWAGAALAFAIAVHGAWAIRRFGQLRSPLSVTGIALQLGAGCALVARSGAKFSGPVDPSTVVLGSLVILAIRESAGRSPHRAIVAPDMLAEDDFRRLRVALKWGGFQESDGRPADST
jgi:hypothetical protein